MLHKILTIGIIALLTLPAHARFKCWTNADGVRECGEKVPPEYAQQGHEEVNKLGITVKQQERAKTEDEIAEEKRQQERDRQQARIQAEKDNRDRILLETFSSTDDIEMTRDGKIAALETAINLTEKRNGKLQEDLDVLMARAALQERKGKQPSEVLVKDIQSLRRQMDNNKQFIEDKRVEQDAMYDEYDAYIKRFLELNPEQAEEQSAQIEEATN